MTQIMILAAALVLATAVGLLLRRRAGRVRSSYIPTAGIPTAAPDRAHLLAKVGLNGDGPTVLHFSADWCGPCAAVRRVVSSTVAQLADSPRPPADVELDIDEHPAIAKELGVLSLPTTFIFDAAATERFRISGVPSAADLRTALAPLSG